MDTPMTIAYIALGCGLFCSSISIAYSFGVDQRSKRKNAAWLKRASLFAAIGLGLLFLEVRI